MFFKGEIFKTLFISKVLLSTLSLKEVAKMAMAISVMPNIVVQKYSETFSVIFGPFNVAKQNIYSYD